MEDYNFDDESTVRDIFIPPANDVQKILFYMSYFFAGKWNEIMLDIYQNGYDFFGRKLTSIMMFDAIDRGLIMPIYAKTPEGDERMFFQVWNPLDHMYTDFDDIDLLNHYWLAQFLLNGIWSYN